MKKNCKKKYCKRCLEKFYTPEKLKIDGAWVCPSCHEKCSCANCRSKKNDFPVSQATPAQRDFADRRPTLRCDVCQKNFETERGYEAHVEGHIHAIKAKPPSLPRVRMESAPVGIEGRSSAMEIFSMTMSALRRHEELMEMLNKRN